MITLPIITRTLNPLGDQGKANSEYQVMYNIIGVLFEEIDYLSKSFGIREANYPRNYKGHEKIPIYWLKFLCINIETNSYGVIKVVRH